MKRCVLNLRKKKKKKKTDRPVRVNTEPIMALKFVVSKKPVLISA